MRFDVLTLFPALFKSYIQQSLLKKAIDASLVGDEADAFSLEDIESICAKNIDAEHDPASFRLGNL